MERVIEMIENNRDKNLYKVVFDTLTKMNTLNNYSHNKNGIYFNLGSFEKKEIDELQYILDKWIDLKDKNEKLEFERKDMIEKLSASLVEQKDVNVKPVCKDTKKEKIIRKKEYNVDNYEEDTKNRIFSKPKKGVYARLYNSMYSKVTQVRPVSKEPEADTEMDVEKESICGEQEELFGDSDYDEKDLFGEETDDENNDKILDEDILEI